MLKVLVKKQLGEVFKSYFYDAKKNKMRSKLAIAGWIIFFIVIMVGMLGGIFTFLSFSLCGSLTAVGMGWMYFLIMDGIAILLGAFGSVFNTYAGLYLAKDNDLLLSLPIPVGTIMASRMINVYLMGAMYSATALIPALIVYWIIEGITVSRVICGILLFLIVTLTVMILSCVLGWAVARISLKLKNKSFITVLVSLLFVGGYYFFYFRANALIQKLILNAEVYGEKIKGASHLLYTFGTIGEGSLSSAALFLAVTVLLLALVCTAISRSFLKIAASGGSTEKIRYTEKAVKEKSVFSALLGKEFARFTASPNYMLNCGLGILLLTAFGVLLLIKGQSICDVIGQFLSMRPDAAAILLFTGLCLLTSMNDMAAPSVSLEGKSLWIPRSLPIEAKTVLRAKASVQLILTEIPMLFASVCAAGTVETSLPVKLMLVITPLVYGAFSALCCTVIGLRMPILNWTDEIMPIKQSGAVMLALFGSWLLGIAPAGLYLFAAYKIGAAGFLLVWAAVLAAAAVFLLKWLDTKGAKAFESL